MSATPSSTPSYNISDNLPPGWEPTSRPGTTRSSIILGLSLALSILICLLIISCVYRRKSKRRKRFRDVEKRGAKHLRADDSRIRDLILLKELKQKQKLWSKATARWKDNVRYSARLRRGKRHHVAIQPPLQTPDNELENDHQTLQTVTSLSRHSTIESAHASQPPAAPLDSPIPARDPDPFPLSDASSVAGISPSPVSPPAYNRRASTSLAPISTGDDHTGDGNQRFLTSYSSAGISGPSIPDAAHVATDDKAVLSYMANLASSPPIEASHSSQIASSAPILDDDDLEDYLHDSDSLPGLDRSAHPFQSSFPPPPPKGHLTPYYHYRYSYGDIARELDIGPSAPPFEEGQPSCPPLDDLEVMASAPPLPAADHCEADSSSPEPFDHPPSAKNPGDDGTDNDRDPCQEDNCIPPTHGRGLTSDRTVPPPFYTSQQP